MAGATEGGIRGVAGVGNNPFADEVIKMFRSLPTEYCRTLVGERHDPGPMLLHWRVDADRRLQMYPCKRCGIMFWRERKDT